MPTLEERQREMRERMRQAAQSQLPDHHEANRAAGVPDTQAMRRRRLRALRHAAKMSQLNFGRALGFNSASTISNMESGRRAVTRPTILHAERFLQLLKRQRRRHREYLRNRARDQVEHIPEDLRIEVLKRLVRDVDHEEIARELAMDIVDVRSVAACVDLD